MTAIAYRDGIMAADTLTLGGDSVRGYNRKIVRNTESGTMGAAAGQAGTNQIFQGLILSGAVDNWIENDCHSELFDPKCGDRVGGFGAIIVRTNGEVICVDYQGRAIRNPKADFYVEGGAEYTLIGAMAAGATAPEAVAIAIKYDVGCGGEIQIEKLIPNLETKHAPIEDRQGAKAEDAKRVMALIETYIRGTLNRDNIVFTTSDEVVKHGDEWEQLSLQSRQFMAEVREPVWRKFIAKVEELAPSLASYLIECIRPNDTLAHLGIPEDVIGVEGEKVPVRFLATFHEGYDSYICRFDIIRSRIHYERT